MNFLEDCLLPMQLKFLHKQSKLHFFYQRPFILKFILDASAFMSYLWNNGTFNVD